MIAMHINCINIDQKVGSDARGMHEHTFGHWKRT